MTSDRRPLDFEASLATFAGSLNVQHARLVRLVAQAQREGGWLGHQIHSVPHWLTIHLGISPAYAKQIDTIARRAEELPHLMEAFDQGALSIDQVYEVAAKAPAWADQQVTEFARSATVRQLRRMIRDENFDRGPDQPVEERSTPRPVSMSWDEHSRLRITGALDAEQGRIVEGAVDEIRDALFHAGETDVTIGDALVEMARRSLAVAGARGQRFPAQVHVHVDTGAVQLTHGVALPPAIAEYLLCDSTVRPVWERDCIPFGVGRSQRTVPTRTREVIEHRDQGCIVPGCTARHVEIHHIVPWSQGGTTETSNLVSLCGRHHKSLHQGLLRISGNADVRGGLTITDDADRPLAQCASPVFPKGPMPQPTVPYEHPSGERLQRDWVGLGWVHPDALAERRRRLAEHHRRRGDPLAMRPAVSVPLDT